MPVVVVPGTTGASLDELHAKPAMAAAPIPIKEIRFIFAPADGRGLMASTVECIESDFPTIVSESKPAPSNCVSVEQKKLTPLAWALAIIIFI